MEIPPWTKQSPPLVQLGNLYGSFPLPCPKHSPLLCFNVQTFLLPSPTSGMWWWPFPPSLLACHLPAAHLVLHHLHLTLSSNMSSSACPPLSKAQCVLHYLLLTLSSNTSSMPVPKGSFSPPSDHRPLPFLHLGFSLQLSLQVLPLAPTTLLLPGPFPSSHLPSLCSGAWPLSFLGAGNLLRKYEVLPQVAGGDKCFVDNEPNEDVFKAAWLLACSPQLIVCKPISVQSSVSLHITSSWRGSSDLFAL